MLDPKLVRQSMETVSAALKKRGFLFDERAYQSLEEERKSLQVSLQSLQNERNARSKDVGMAKAKGLSTDSIMSGLKALSDDIAEKESRLESIQTSLDELLMSIPNLPHVTTPIGHSEADNVLVRQWGTPKSFSFTPKDHVALAERNGIDFESAAKLSGARFVVLKGSYARLQRALIQFMLDMHVNEHGYTEVCVPYIVNAACFYGTGQLPKFKDDLFEIRGDVERYLIPTAEVPVTNLVRDEIVDASSLPLKYTAYTSCFRSEAGSYGKDMRGMLRQHQFEKVEMVQIVKPDDSYQALEALTQHAEKVLQRLELPYRVMALCTGDIGFQSAKTYDIEVWLPGQDCYREISSCSNIEDFQARRMKARYRDADGKIAYLHTLNGSGLAVGRTMIAIIENGQDELGRVHIPTALQPYMNGLTVIDPV